MPGATSDNFRTAVLGGKDLMKRKGIPFDFVCGIARYTYRNSCQTYGPTQPGILCRSWVHKMQWFLNEEQTSEQGADTTFDASFFDRYKEPSELLNEEADPVCGAAFQRRLDELRQLLR